MSYVIVGYSFLILLYIGYTKLLLNTVKLNVWIFIFINNSSMLGTHKSVDKGFIYYLLTFKVFHGFLLSYVALKQEVKVRISKGFSIEISVWGELHLVAH